MTHKHAARGWSITLPIIGQRRRFVSYPGALIGVERPFFLTRKAAREFIRQQPFLSDHGARVARATLTLTVIEEQSKRPYSPKVRR